MFKFQIHVTNTLFDGDFTKDDMLSYARTLKGKMAEDATVMEQVKNNSQEQAMMGGFKESMNDAIIDSMEVHQNLATQALSEDKILKEENSI